VRRHVGAVAIAAADLESSVSALPGGSSAELEVFVHAVAGAVGLQAPGD
jgi:hypothetical protein